MKFKRAVSILLSLGIAFNAMPVFAVSEGEKEDTPVSSSLETEEKKEEEIKETAKEENAGEEKAEENEIKGETENTAGEEEEKSMPLVPLEEAQSTEENKPLDAEEIIDAVPLTAALALQENIKETKQEGQVQTYYAEDGSMHKIYWLQGVTPPLMPSKPEDEGKEGFFYKETIIDEKNGITHETFNAPYEEGKGYYDINKTDNYGTESHLCYLATASNLLHWWFDQNSTYVAEYLDGLKNGTYGQEEGLRRIVPGEGLTQEAFDKMWNDMLASPPVVTVGDAHNTQIIKKDPLIQTAFRAYVNHDDGYFPHGVVDFYINGYPMIQEQPIIDTPETYKKDQRGGYFYPVFGREPVAEEIKGNFEYLSKKIKDYILTGHGLGLAYLFGNNNLAHAVTVWGAEYDENDVLVRLYLTNSDDIGNIVGPDNSSIGLHTTNVYEDDGVMYLSSEKTKGKIAGSKIQGIMSISLAQDRWETALKDTSKPQKPVITVNPESKSYALGTDASYLKAEGKISDNGFLTYQWYKAENENEEGILIKDADKNTYKPSAEALGTSYYYCLISNNKNGYVTSEKTAYAKIDVLDIEKVDAQKPKINYFTSDQITYIQYAEPYALSAEATVTDGGTLTYQWYVGSNSNTSAGTVLRGETNPVFIPPTDHVDNPDYMSDKRFYYCVVTNTNNADFITGNNVAKTVSPAKRVKVNENSAYPDKTVTDTLKPVIGIQPKAPENAYKKGDTAQPLKVYGKAYDGGKTSFQWYELSNGVEKAIPSANEAVFTPPTDVQGERTYFCRVINRNENAKNNKDAHRDTDSVTVKVEGTEKPVENGFVKGRISSFDNGKDISLKLISGGNVKYEEKITPSGKDADFEILNVLPGQYDLLIEKDGFTSSRIEKITVTGAGIDLKTSLNAQISNIMLYIGDLNHDGNIDALDLANLTSSENLGKVSQEDLPCDLNKDGNVDFDDVKLLRSSLNFNKSSFRADFE